MATVLSLPESPRRLIKKGMIDEARAVLASLDGLSDHHHHTVNKVITDVQKSLTTDDQAKSSSARNMFKMGKTRNFHRALLAFMRQYFQQISEINLITYYAATIYENYLHLSPVSSRVLAACTGTEFFMASWIAVYTIERCGRRKLMLIGAVGKALSIGVLAFAAWAIDPHQGIDSSAAAIVATVFLFVFNTFFAIGWLCMSWLYPAEVEIRATATGVSTASNWIFNFLIVLITPVAFQHIGWKTYIICAAISSFIVPSVYFFFPETAYRSLEEIDAIFQKSGWLSVVYNARPSVTPLAMSSTSPHMDDTTLVPQDSQNEKG